MKTTLLLGIILFNEDSAVIKEVSGVILCDNLKDAEELGEQIQSLTGCDYIIPEQFKEGHVIYPSSMQITNNSIMMMR